MNLVDDLVAFARQTLGLPDSVLPEAAPLGARGSDRTFFRLAWGGGQSAIAIRYDTKRVENAYYADLAHFLGTIGVPVPRVLGHDPVQCLMVMEDLGDKDLWSARNAPWGERGSLYRNTLAMIHRLHSFPEKKFPWGKVPLMEGFGPRLYRWERDYFRDHFVGNVCGVRLGDTFGKALEEELSGLADRLSQGTRCLIHRDLQSRNVMIRGGEPVFIDFQGMRFGSPFYDLGSLLCDPYVEFAGRERDELLDHYYGLSDRSLDRPSFAAAFWEGAAQRLMQALGAYGFLGLSRGLPAFLHHIPAGLRNLRLAASRSPSLSLLLELCGLCEQKLGPSPQRNPGSLTGGQPAGN